MCRVCERVVVSPTSVFRARDGGEDARCAWGAVGAHRALGPVVVEVRGAPWTGVAGRAGVGVLEVEMEKSR